MLAIVHRWVLTRTSNAHAHILGGLLQLVFLQSSSRLVMAKFIDSEAQHDGQPNRSVDLRDDTGSSMPSSSSDTDSSQSSLSASSKSKKQRKRRLIFTGDESCDGKSRFKSREKKHGDSEITQHVYMRMIGKF